jgi:hypothetical protein
MWSVGARCRRRAKALTRFGDSHFLHMRQMAEISKFGVPSKQKLTREIFARLQLPPNLCAITLSLDDYSSVQKIRVAVAAVCASKQNSSRERARDNMTATRADFTCARDNSATD